jgi:hypothetical protein
MGGSAPVAPLTTGLRAVAVWYLPSSSALVQEDVSNDRPAPTTYCSPSVKPASAELLTPPKRLSGHCG